MDSIREEGDRLILEQRPGRLARFFWVLAAGMTVWLAVGLVRDRHFVHEERFVGLLVGAAILALSALFISEESQFVFDRGQQRLTWRRRWLFRRTQGTVPFADIELVNTERPMSDDGVPSRRAVVRTTNGILPLTVAYIPDPDEACVRLADRIQSFIRPTPAAPDTRG